MQLDLLKSGHIGRCEMRRDTQPLTLKNLDHMVELHIRSLYTRDETTHRGNLKQRKDCEKYKINLTNLAVGTQLLQFVNRDFPLCAVNLSLIGVKSPGIDVLKKSHTRSFWSESMIPADDLLLNVESQGTLGYTRYCKRNMVLACEK